MILSVVIVSWNTRELLRGCLESLLASTHLAEIEVFVVDNASTDASQEMVRGAFPQVHLLENSTNLGFARANNQAIRQCSGRYILLLNSDTLVRPGALDALVEFMDSHPSAGGCGARLLNPDGSLQASCSPAPTLWGEFKRMFHFPGVRSDGYYQMDDWDQSTPRQVDVLLGACLLLRRQVLDQVGMLDENYFIYSEEVDLCYRCRATGWELFWVPTGEVVHYGGQSTRQVSEVMFIRLYEAKLIYFRKNHGRIKAFFYKLVLISASLFRLMLVPLAWLEKPPKRQAHLALASNYQRLLENLPGM